MDWAKWIQDTVSDLLGYLDEISRSLQRLAAAAEDEASRGR